MASILDYLSAQITRFVLTKEVFTLHELYPPIKELITFNIPELLFESLLDYEMVVVDTNLTQETGITHFQVTDKMLKLYL